MSNLNLSSEPLQDLHLLSCAIESSGSTQDRFLAQVELLKYICGDRFAGGLTLHDPGIIWDAYKSSRFSLTPQLVKCIWDGDFDLVYQAVVRNQTTRIKSRCDAFVGDSLYWTNVLLTAAQACSVLYELEPDALLRFWHLHGYCRILRWAESTDNEHFAYEAEISAYNAVRGALGSVFFSGISILLHVSIKYIECLKLWLRALVAGKNRPTALIIVALDPLIGDQLLGILSRSNLHDVKAIIIHFYFDFERYSLYGNLESSSLDSFWCHKISSVLAVSRFSEKLIVCDVDAFCLTGLIDVMSSLLDRYPICAQSERGIPLPLSKAYGKGACLGFFALNTLDVDPSLLSTLLRLTAIFGDDQSAFNTMTSLGQPGFEEDWSFCSQFKGLYLLPESIAQRGGIPTSNSILWHPQFANSEFASIESLVGHYFLGDF